MNCVRRPRNATSDRHFLYQRPNFLSLSLATKAKRLSLWAYISCQNSYQSANLQVRTTTGGHHLHQFDITCRYVDRTRAYHGFFLRFCRTWTKRYLITSQTRVKRVRQIHHRTIFDLLRKMVRWCIRLTRLTLVCEVIRYRLVQVRQNLKKKRLFGLAAHYRPSLSLPPSFSSSSYFLSFSKPKAYHGIRHSSTGRRKIVTLQGNLFRRPLFYSDHFFLHCGVRQALL